MGIPYELVFRPGDVLGSLLQIREAYPSMPMAPTVRIDGGFLVESGAILDVLIARYGHGELAPPANTMEYMFHAQWMHFSEATAMARMATKRYMAAALGIDVDQVPTGYRLGDDIEKPAMVGSLGIFDFVEDYLARCSYFGGRQFSGADIMMHYALRGAKLLVGIDPEGYSHIGDWKRRVEERPAYRRSVQAALPGGEDEFGLPAGQPLPFPPLPADRLRKK